MIHLETAGYMILHEPQYLLYAGCSNVQLFCCKMNNTSVSGRFKDNCTRGGNMYQIKQRYGNARCYILKCNKPTQG